MRDPNRLVVFLGGTLFGMGFFAIALIAILLFEPHVNWKNGILVSDEETFIAVKQTIPVMAALLIGGFISVLVGVGLAFCLTDAQ